MESFYHRFLVRDFVPGPRVNCVLPSLVAKTAAQGYASYSEFRCDVARSEYFFSLHDVVLPSSAESSAREQLQKSGQWKPFCEV